MRGLEFSRILNASGSSSQDMITDAIHSLLIISLFQIAGN